ncbi:MAG: type IV pilus modification protein PilV [Pseudomonadales bacterium]
MSRKRESAMMKARAPRAAGFSMIELLVAVLVMGIGVLGVTGLQMVSLQNNRTALERAEAVQLAYDMMDRIRANPEGAPPGTAYDGLALGDAPQYQSCVSGDNCSGAQMVTFHEGSWKCVLGRFVNDAACASYRADGVIAPAADQPGLPNGDGAIAVDGNGVVTITVQWTEANNQVQTVVIDSQG